MAEWVQDVLLGGGLAVLFLLVLAENLFPPIPSELILPLAGFLVAKDELEFVPAVLAATAGSVAGAFVLYALSRSGGRPLLLRHRRALRMTEERLDRAEGWFDRHGPKVVFFGRMVPGLRSVVSVPAGLAAMPAAAFGLLTCAGSALWNLALIGAGWALGDNWERVTHVIEDADLFLLAGGLLAAAAWLVVRRRRTRR